MSTGDIRQQYLQRAKSKIYEKIAKKSKNNAVYDWLLIGVGGSGASALLLDPSVVDEDGEWLVVEHDKDEGLDTYSNFIEYIDETADALGTEDDDL